MKINSLPNFSIDINNPVDALGYEQLIHCMRCGLCLPTCPTYSLYQLEKTSPRGRLSLMRAVSEGRLDMTDGFIGAMNLCLGCLACQTACPAGVPFGDLLERAHQQSEAKRKEKRIWLSNLLRKFLLTRLLYEPCNLEPLMPLLRIYQKIGLHRLNLARLIPSPFGDWERMLPRMSTSSTRQELGKFVPANPPVLGRVGLIIGCMENTLLSKMCLATVRVLAFNGFDVVIPPNQVCCGALPCHLGELKLAIQQARCNIDAFEAAGIDVVINDAVGCSAQLKEYDHLLSDDPVYAQKAKYFSSKAEDVTEFLASHLPLRKGMYPLNIRLSYDDPCHLIHAQGIYNQPRELLMNIPGVELIELSEATWCCGSAGAYNLTHIEESNAILERKMAYIKEMDIDILATANTGCYIQLAKGIRDAGLDIRVCHITELIALAYGLTEA